MTGADRLFVAVIPPPDVLAAVARLPRPPEPGVRWVQPADWHVTLRFLGDVDHRVVTARLDDCAGSLDMPTARLGPAVSRLGRSVLCLPVGGLESLSAAVASATATVGEPPDPRPFAGHLTLARLGRRGTCGLAGHRLGAAWTVHSIVLWGRSPHRRGDRHYVELGRWDLRPVS